MGKFKVGDLLRFKKDSWWLNRSDGFRDNYNYASLVLVTDDLMSSEKFFYGTVCDSGETHLWTTDQFDMVSEADSNDSKKI
jgi:hypothetical protein